jgi:hypothetical protein
MKSKVNTTIQGLIDKNGSKYSWHEIEACIVRSYLFRFAKRCSNDEEQAITTAIKKTLVLLSFGSALPSYLPYCQLLGEQDSPSAPGPSPRPAHGSATSTAYGDSTRPQRSNVGEAQLLKSYTWHVTRIECDQTHEDTIDVFLKSVSAHSSGRCGLDGHEFSILKSEPAENISYHKQTGDLLSAF